MLPVTTRGGHEVLCSADAARICFTRTMQDTILLLENGELLHMGRHQTMFELQRGGQDQRFVSALHKGVYPRPNTGNFNLSQFVGYSLAPCSKPLSTVPLFSAVQQFEEKGSLIWPDPNTCLAAGHYPGVFPPPAADVGTKIQACLVKPRQNRLHERERGLVVLRIKEEKNLQYAGRLPLYFTLPSSLLCLTGTAAEELIRTGTLEQASPVPNQAPRDVKASLLVFFETDAEPKFTEFGRPYSAVLRVQSRTAAACTRGPSTYTTDSIYWTHVEVPVKAGVPVQRHFTVTYAPALGAGVPVEVEPSIMWSPEALHEDCKIADSITAPQEHLRLKSQILFGMQVFCKVLQLRIMKRQRVQLLFFPHKGPNKTLLLSLPPGSVVLQRQGAWPAGVYAAWVYDLWPAEGLSAALTPLYFQEHYPREQVHVYLMILGGNVSAAGVLQKGNKFVDKPSAKTYPFIYTTLYGEPVPVGFTRLQGGMGLRLGRVPESFLLYDDLMTVSRGGMEERIMALSELGRDVEEFLDRCRRLMSQSYLQDIQQAALLEELSSHLPLLQLRLGRLHAAFMAAQQAPPGSAFFDLIIQLHYLDNHSHFSVLLRFPCLLRGFHSMRDLAPQVQRALLLLLQAFNDPFSVPAATASAMQEQGEAKKGDVKGGKKQEIRLPKKDKVSSFFLEAAETALHLLSRGYCRPCPEVGGSDDVQRGRCGMCGATRVGSTAILSFKDISPSADTLPAVGYWRHRVTENFLLRVGGEEPDKPTAFYGVDFDHHTNLELPSQLSESFAAYGKECIRAKQIEELKPFYSEEGLGLQCPSAAPFAMNCLGHLSFLEAAPVLVASDLLLQHIHSACTGVKPSRIVTECLEHDNGLVGLRRLRALQLLGHTRLYEILYGLTTPRPSEPFLQALVDAKPAFQSMPSGPVTSAVLDMVASAEALLQERLLPSLMSLVFGWSAFLLDLALKIYRQTQQSCYLFTSAFLDDPLSAVRMVVENKVPPPASAGLLRPVPQYDEEIEQAEAADQQKQLEQERAVATAEAAGKAEMRLPAPVFNPVDRKTLQRLSMQQIQQFVSSLREDFPLLFACTYRLLGWPEDRYPQNHQELLKVEDAYYEARAQLGQELIPDVLAQFYKNWLKEYEALQEAVVDTPEKLAERERRLKQHVTPPPYDVAARLPPSPAPQPAARVPAEEEPEAEAATLAKAAAAAPKATLAKAAAAAPKATLAKAAAAAPKATLAKAAAAAPKATLAKAAAAAPKALGRAEEEAGVEEDTFEIQGRPTRTRTAFGWPYVRRQLTSNFGPSTRMPVWITSSPTCPCADPTLPRGCLLDTVKTSSDVVLRLSLLVPPAVEGLLLQHSATYGGGRGVRLSPELAAFCTTAGLFANVWQQQAVATGNEEPGSRRASSMLVARLARQDTLLLKLSTGPEKRGNRTFRQRRTAYKKFIRSPPYRECRALLAKAGALVHAPYRTRRRTASSLYGAITNAIGVFFGDQERATAGFIHLTERLLLQYQRPLSLRLRYKANIARALTALLAALHVSSIYKNCFSTAVGWQPRLWYYMHFDGRSLLQRATDTGWSVADAVSDLAYGFGEPKLDPSLFEKSFYKLSKTITPSWEAENLFRTLVNYTPGEAASLPVDGIAHWERSPFGGSATARVNAAGTSHLQQVSAAWQQPPHPQQSQQQQVRYSLQHPGKKSGSVVEISSVSDPEGPGSAAEQQAGQTCREQHKDQRQRKKREQHFLLPFAATKKGSTSLLRPAGSKSICVRKEAGALQPDELRFVTSLRYRARKRSEEGTAYVNLVLELSNEEMRRLPELTAADVLQLLQTKILASARQLAAQPRHVSRGEPDTRPTRSRATAGEAETRRGRAGEEEEREGQTSWRKELVALASYLERDARRRVPHASLELNRWSLPPLSAGALLFSAFQNAIEHKRVNSALAENLLLLVVQIPDKLV